MPRLASITLRQSASSSIAFAGSSQPSENGSRIGSANAIAALFFSVSPSSPGSPLPDTVNATARRIPTNGTPEVAWVCIGVAIFLAIAGGLYAWYHFYVKDDSDSSDIEEGIGIKYAKGMSGEDYDDCRSSRATSFHSSGASNEAGYAMPAQSGDEYADDQQEDIKKSASFLVEQNFTKLF